MSDFKPLLDPQQALSSYLADMLDDELPEAADVSAAPEPVADSTVTTTAPVVIRPALPFQALLFEVNGFSLALPLMVLDGIEKWPDVTLSKMPGKPAHYLGLLSKPQQHTQVIDPAAIFSADAALNATPAYILLVDDKRWGIAVSSVKKVITVTETDIRWRDAGQRPWLLGTLVNGLTSVIALPKLIESF